MNPENIYKSNIEGMGTKMKGLSSTKKSALKESLRGIQMR